MLQKINLNGKWEMRRSDEETWYEGTIPGSVYSDLMAQGRMEDPFWRDNEMNALPLMDHDWVYRRAFGCDEKMLQAEYVFLSFDGLDTLARITLNGEKIAETDNMHRSWRFEVSSLLAEQNMLEICFSSPTRFMEKAIQGRHMMGSTDCIEGYQFIRKAHCMSGWDWGPRLPDCGIFRNVSLEIVDRARIQSVLIHQEHMENRVTLRFDPELEILETADYTLHYTVTAPDGKKWSTDKYTVTIENPSLWWPNGYGDQTLYDVCAELRAGTETLDAWERKIGLREMKLERKPDGDGDTFRFVCNGLPLFLMGADYIPEDNILSRVTEERSRQLLSDCVEVNFNAIRIWGGGYYLDDFFYDLCDEMGLVIWHDFMFACASYLLTPEFDRNIRAEIADNVQRLRHHPSIGLWCGNNEMEDQVKYFDDPQAKADYIKIFEYIIPDVVKQVDPERDYWPSSPSSGGGFDEPQASSRGDVHDWTVWHGEKPFTWFRSTHYRFVSEFGFQSFPCLKTVESFTEPGDRNIFSYVMEKHQRNGSANSKILNYLGQTFLYPNSFDMLLYASQLLQMEAIRYGVEHWRRQRGYCMGAIYWQLNDCWPVASWSGIDYYGRWKALHYAAKRFFAPLLLSCEEQGTLSQRTNVNQEHQEIEQSVRFNVVNETGNTRNVTVRYTLRKNTGEIRQAYEEKLQVLPYSTTWLEKRVFPEMDIYTEYISYALYEEEQEISHASVLLTAPKHFRFLNPELSVTRNGNELTVTSASYSHFVEIVCEDGDVVLDDNDFDMDPGTRTVRILRGNGSRFSVRSVYDIR